MKIRTKLMLSAALFAIIPMIIYAVFSGMTLSSNGQTEFRKQITDILNNEAATLQTYLDTVHSQLDTLAGIDEVKNADGKSDTLNDILKQYAGENPTMDSAILINASGNIFAGSKNVGKDFENFSKMSEYKDNVLYINNIISEKTAANSTDSTMFIKRKLGKNTLVIMYKISSETNVFISSITNNSAFYNQGKVIIIDPKKNWTSGTSYNNNLLTMYPAVVTDRINSLSDNQATDIITYNDNTGIMETEVYAGLIRVGGEDGLIALASCPANRAVIISSGASSVVVGFVVFLSIVAIAGAVLIAMMFTKPLKNIEETLEKIRRGDHETRIAVDAATRMSEYGRISSTFNDMVDEIVVSEDRYRTITEMSDNIIFDWNFKTNDVFFSNNFNKKFSYRPPSDHFGDSFLLKAKIHPDDAARYNADLELLGKGEEFKHNEYRMKNIYGDFIWVLIRTATLRDADGNPLKVVGVMLDIDRAKKSEQQLTERASYDALTELYNRETIESQINSEILLSEARKSEFAVLFVDVDDFKHFNDQYSHATGDQVLKFVGRTLKAAVGEFGFVGRYGGDEFIACIRNAEINDPAKVAQTIIQKLDEGFTADTDDHLTVSVSIGIAVIKDDYNTRAEYIIGKSDDAMYSVKKNGKSNYAYI
ncbi:MAG: diguanylate cyclase [Oscillospiraceae bacterium]